MWLQKLSSQPPALHYVSCSQFHNFKTQLFYNKFTKVSNNKKQFKKIASEQIKISMDEIDRIYTLVGSCRESDYDIEVEELDYREI